jgi:hypothetical protein
MINYEGKRAVVTMNHWPWKKGDIITLSSYRGDTVEVLGVPYYVNYQKNPEWKGYIIPLSKIKLGEIKSPKDWM